MNIEPTDLRIETLRDPDAGGWTRETPKGIRITHMPTGKTATRTDGRSQHLNKHNAMEELRAQLADDEDERFYNQIWLGALDRQGCLIVFQLPVTRLMILTFDHKEDFLASGIIDARTGEERRTNTQRANIPYVSPNATS